MPIVQVKHVDPACFSQQRNGSRKAYESPIVVRPPLTGRHFDVWVGAGDSIECHEGDVAERAVWTALARAVMNTDEFVSKE